MAKAGFRIIDAEPHFFEPHDLWERNLEEPFRSLTKTTFTAPGRIGEGGLRPEVVGLETPKVEAKPLVQRRALRRVPLNDHMAKVTARPEPEVFIEGFDVEGIDVGVFMPTYAMGMVRFDDLNPAHAVAICRVYNDYAADFVRSDPARFKFWAWVPPQDAALAAGEARRCVEELGAIGVAMTGGAVDGHLLSDDFFEPLWAQMNDLAVPFGLHGPPPNYYLRDNIAHRYRGHRGMQIVAQVLGNPFHAQTEVAELILGGVLERHPNLRPLFMEVNASWLPWLLWRMDEKWEMNRPDLEFPLSMKPSDYFRRQCYAEVEPDEVTAKYVIDYLGADNLLFSTDYPHSDSLFPEAVNTFLALDGVSDGDKRKILWDNGARYFGL
jgi:predicted TIM-barrel fold metal-dependent hydrolase